MSRRSESSGRAAGVLRASHIRPAESGRDTGVRELIERLMDRLDSRGRVDLGELMFRMGARHDAEASEPAPHPEPMPPLTHRQYHVLQALFDYTEETGQHPTLRSAADRLGVRQQSILTVLNALWRKEYLAHCKRGPWMLTDGARALMRKQGRNRGPAVAKNPPAQQTRTARAGKESPTPSVR